MARSGARGCMKTKARIRFASPSLHYWANAPENRSYLRQPHRHLFHVRVDIEVRHNEREIEFHDLLDAAKQFWPLKEDGCVDWSCETMAKELAESLAFNYPGREIEVEVSEDGECGAVVSYEP